MLNNVKKILKRKYYSLLTLISPKLNTKARYYDKFGKKLNLKNPITFNEKLLYLKLNNYMYNPLVIQCADKYAVRSYVKECGYEHLLNDLISVYDTVDEIIWSELPNSFAIKWNFGATYNIICPDKDKLDISKAKLQLKTWGKSKYWLPYSEMQYKYCDKKIICERYLDSKKGFLPFDYKLYCFNGEVKAILFISDRDSERKVGFFTKEWTYLGPPDKCEDTLIELPKCPVSLKEMVKCAEDLSKGIPFVRIDFYEYDNKPIFGEMTFTPAGGLHVSQINIGGKPMGDFIKIQ